VLLTELNETLHTSRTLKNIRHVFFCIGHNSFLRVKTFDGVIRDGKQVTERPNISPGICFIKVKVIPEETFDEKSNGDFDNDLHGYLKVNFILSNENPLFRHPQSKERKILRPNM